MKTRACLLFALLLAGCDTAVETPRETTASHARMAPYTPVPPGAVPRGARAQRQQEATPPEPTPALIAQGRQRYEIFCAPCHGADGRGDGVVTQRGFPRPPAFNDERQRSLSLERIFETVSDGAGVMYGFAERVSPADRWAISHYVRELQRAPQAAGPAQEAAP